MVTQFNGAVEVFGWSESPAACGITLKRTAGRVDEGQTSDGERVAITIEVASEELGFGDLEGGSVFLGAAKG